MHSVYNFKKCFVTVFYKVHMFFCNSVLCSCFCCSSHNVWNNCKKLRYQSMLVDRIHRFLNIVLTSQPKHNHTFQLIVQRSNTFVNLVDCPYNYLQTGNKFKVIDNFWQLILTFYKAEADKISRFSEKTTKLN